MAYILLYDPYITPKVGSGPQVDGLHLELRSAWRVAPGGRGGDGYEQI